MVINYNNGKIYKIVSDEDEMVYVGSTTQPLSSRMSGHRAAYKRFLNGKTNNVTSFEILKFESCKIVLIEDYPCERKDQLHTKERFYIESLNCVNRCLPGRTNKEWKQANKEKNKEKDREWRQANKEYNKEWRQANKEKIKEKDRKYRQNNKEKIAKKQRERRLNNREIM